MARISKATMSDKHPPAWAEGAAAARAARGKVTEQLADLIRFADLTGSPDLVALRIRNYATAQAADDRIAQRAALMELATACAVTAAGIDVENAPASPW